MFISYYILNFVHVPQIVWLDSVKCPTGSTGDSTGSKLLILRICKYSCDLIDTLTENSKDEEFLKTIEVSTANLSPILKT